MREVKYRYWDNESKVMLGPDLPSERYRIVSYDGLALLDVQREDEYGYEYQMDVEFLQYTGLKDKNGKEIYEGDIVRVMRNDYENHVVCYDTNQAKYKTIPPSTYYANAGNGGWTGYELRGYGEVIGNIYENKELLDE